MKAASKKPSATSAKDASFQKKDAAFFSQQSTPTPFFGNAVAAVQPKLTVGKANDQYEKEADSTAEKVVQRLNAPRQTTPTETGVQAKSLASGISPLVQQKCDECDDKDKQEQQEENLQKKEAAAGEGTVSPSVESKLSSTKGGGSPLPAGVNQSMSNAFGSDFSGVRVHTGSDAAQMSRQLNAQAFTHGSDIYFNSGKYDTSSKEGQQLLAHELTHTVQQGAVKNQPSQTVSRTPQVQKDEAKKNIKDLDVAALKALGETKYGFLSKNKGKVSVHFKDFPSKQYIGPFVTKDNKGNEYLASPPFKKPTEERKTRQASVWRKEALPRVTVLLNNFIKKKNITGTEYELKLNENKNVAVTGTVDQIAKQVIVPFWGMDGRPVSFQIEHKVDWQIAGGNHNVDVISNLILLDAKSNIAIGQKILADMKSFYAKVIDFYAREKGVEGLAADFGGGSGLYDIFCENLISVGESVKGTLISISNFEETSVQTPFTESNIDISDLQIPDDKFVLKTSKSGAGMLVPWNLENDFISIKGDKKKKELKSITLKNVVKDEKGNIDLAQPDKNLVFHPDGLSRYKVDSAGYAAVLRNIFRGIKGLSPVEWSEVDFNPVTGWNATGKVLSDLSFLKDVDIDIILENSVFTVQATITSEKLKDKLPKPFQIDYCTLGIAISTKKPLTIFGELGFSIEKIGKGSIGAWAGLKGFGLQGKFLFDKNELFKKAEISFSYSKAGKEDDWSVKGMVEVAENKIKGVKSGTIEIGYEHKTITGKGNAVLSIPGVDKVEVEAIFAEKSFSITGKVTLKEIKGLKSGEISITVSKEEGKDYRLSGKGRAEPDFPSIKELSGTIEVMYDDGLFDARLKMNYKKGKFDGTIEVGVTNRQVDEKGQPVGDPADKGELVAFGFGALTIELFKGIKGTVTVRITPERDLLVSGDIELKDLSPFGEGYNFEKELFKFPRITIPLIGIPGVSLSAFVDGGVYFKFNWQPLVLKQLKVGFEETNINEIEDATINIHGSVGSVADAEVYMTINAGLEARVLVATLSGSLGGEAGLGIRGEAGGELDAFWNKEKGLQLKEIRAFLDVTPRAVFRLTGTISIDLDLWITTVNLYYKKYVFAEKELDLSGLTLKLDFPIRFDEQNKVIMPSLDKINLQKPNFTGSQGKDILDKAINGDAEKELEEKKKEIKADIKRSLREKSKEEDFSFSDYTNDMVEKYGKSDELKEFVLKTIQEESRAMEYERFEKLKTDLRNSPMPLNSKMSLLNILSSFNRYVSAADVQAFRLELIQLDQEKKMREEAAKNQDASQQPPAAQSNATPVSTGAGNAAAPVQRKPIFESNEEKEEVVQRKTEPETENKEEDKPSVGNIQRTEEKIQRIPQAGEVLPSTDKQRKYYEHRNDVVDIMGKATFNPGDGLANYIASLWENGQDAPVNIKFGTLGSGFIWIEGTGSYITQKCYDIPLALFGPSVRVCQDVPPHSENYSAQTQVIPISHVAFKSNDKGSLVMVVRIVNGFIDGKLGWIAGKQAQDIDPLLDAALAVTSEEAFLPFIFGEEYDGTNYVSLHFGNRTFNGNLFFDTLGTLHLPNQQMIQGRFVINNEKHEFVANLTGKPEGLVQYLAPVIRTDDGELSAETFDLQLDSNWSRGKKDEEEGTFAVSTQLRLSYSNGIIELFGSASYTSARISGEVHIAVTQKSKADQLFEEHAPGTKIEGGVGLKPENKQEGTPEEPLALTGWGNLTFRIISADNKAAPGGKKSALENLEGEAAFVVSSDAYIILSGKVKLPVNWKLTPPLDYRSDDAEDKDKHLFQYKQTVVSAVVPETLGTLSLELGIVADADAHLSPLELYEIEVSGVYSNHPGYRSEVGLTPKFYISGNAGIKVTVTAEGYHKFLGLIKTVGVGGSLTGEARIEAYIDAAPTVRTIWEGGGKPAQYGLSGVIHTGGQATFTLSGNIHVTLGTAKLKVAAEEDYHIGTWKLGEFGVVLKMNEYILGSGEEPTIDYSKMGLNDKRRRNLGSAITHNKEGKGDPDKRKGGFQQEEDGKMKEKGTAFSQDAPPPRPDHNKDPVANKIEEDFLMGSTLHELIIYIGGTREAPTAIIEMSSPEEKPLNEKIEEEKELVELHKMFADPDEEKRLNAQLGDLTAIESEAAAVEKNAKSTAQQAKPEEEPQIAGFDQLDDRLSDYGKKHERPDLGYGTPLTPAPPGKASASGFRAPKSNGASGTMEAKLAEKRQEVGYASFEDFAGTNVAVFRYYVLKPGKNVIDKDAAGPFYQSAVNQSRGLHTEQIIAGELQKIQASKSFRKDYGPDYKIVVDQILTERSPCGMCRNYLARNKSSLIIVTNYHTYYIVHYSGDWIARNRALMLRYGLTPPSLEELNKQYRGGDGDPH